MITKKNKYLLACSVIISLLFFLLPFAQVSAQDITVSQRYSGDYIVDSSSASHDPYDPATNYETLGGSLIQEVYEGLYEYNGNDVTTYRPVLATNYTISPDGLNYTFTIRQNVTFTDGSPLNAYVFQYSIQRAILMNDLSSGIWILDQSVRGAYDFYYGNNGQGMDLNVTQANTFLANASVHANSAYSLSIYLTKPTASFIPQLIFPAAYAVSPSWIITHEPTTYSINQSDDIYGMVSLNNMFPNLSDAQIRNYLGLNDSTAFPNLANSGIVPQTSHTDTQVSYSYFEDHMMGTGPYMLLSEVVGVSIVLIRNDNWWNKSHFHRNSQDVIDAPQKVLLKVVPETETRVLDIKNNQAHSAYIPFANLGEIMNVTTHRPYIDNVNIYTYPSLSTSVLGFNENATISAKDQISQSNVATGYNYASIHSTTDPILKYSWRNENRSLQYASPGNPFSALLFRKAFAYAWNYTGYLNIDLSNQYERLSGVIPTGLFGHQSDLIPTGYIPSQDLATAKALFQKINWKGTISINYNYGNTKQQKAAESLASVIKNLNVGITIKIVEIQWSGTLIYYDTPDSLLMSFYSWAPDYADPSDYVIPFLHTGGIFPSYMHYSNHFVDALIDQADAITNNNTLRNSLYRQMEINASGDYPYIYLSQANNIAIRNRWVTDWNSQFAGNENPMSGGTKFQYIGLEDYVPNTQTTTPNTIPTTTTSSSPQISTTTVFSTLIKTTSQQSNQSTGLVTLFSNIVTALAYGMLLIIPSALILVVYHIRVKIPKSKIATAKEKNTSIGKNETKVSDQTFQKLEQIIRENS